ncbi:MAG: PAS domain S-box protein [Bacteroidetes bacterium]|nr:PAS domain S-box protein [Bacteroidota bacterium]
MKNLKNIFLKQINADQITLQNIRRVIWKVVVGFGLIAGLFFIAVNITHKKLSQLSKTVTAILEPNIKLVKLKEISNNLYSAEASVKAYTIKRDTAYLLSYENYIHRINTRLDTLLLLSSRGETHDIDEANVNQDFSAKIATLKELIVIRVSLFSEYIELKTGESSQDILLQLLHKTKNTVVKKLSASKTDHLKQVAETPKRSFFSKLFSSQKKKEDISSFVFPAVSSDSAQEDIRRLIAKTQQEEKIKAGRILSKEVDIIEREYKVMHHIFSLLNSMENTELVEGVKRIQAATEETSMQINFISNWLSTFGLTLALLFSYFIYRDILKSKRFKEQEQISQYVRSLIEASLDPFVTISSNGIIMDVNEASTKAIGIPRKKIIGTSFSMYFTDYEKAEESIKQIFEKGFITDYHLTLKHVSGKLMDVLYNFSVYKDNEGNILGAFATARDITERKKSEDKFRGLLESSPDAIVIVNSMGNIELVNFQAEKIFGYKRGEIIGKKLETLIPDRFKDIHSCQRKYFFAHPHIRTMGEIIGVDLFGLRKNGKEFPIEVSLGPLKTADGLLISAAIRDVTKQKQASQYAISLLEAKIEAEKAKQKAEDSTKLKDVFLANMSHEIRTPMNAIIGFSDMLSRKNLGQKEREYVTMIKSAGENLLTIINDILDISKIEAGMMTFEKNNFSVKEILKSLNIMLMEKAKAKNLELLFRCEEDVPDVLLGDSVRLTQIIINLVGNAIKFTKRGKVEVNVRVLKNDLDRDHDENILLGFSIKDTGIGIPQDKLEHIFERFQQADSNVARKYGGTGLGLSIAKQLIELQGGTISVKSEFKVGSTFSFYIPYKKSMEVLSAPEVIVKKYNMNDIRKLNILLAEDNPLNVKLISSLFSENSLKLQIVENGSECVGKLKENNFDIILMDMEMPVMSGYEAANVIRNEMKDNIPIIAMTAHAMAGEREKCLSLGMNDYISKPINSNLLFEKIYDLTINSQYNEKQQTCV